MYPVCWVAGDCAIVSSFTSYLGPFNKEFRQLLIERDLVGACARLGVPATPDLKVATFLVDDAEVAAWAVQVRTRRLEALLLPGKVTRKRHTAR